MFDMSKEGVYESKFEYPLMRLVRDKAEELDISYHDALVLVKPEYVKTIRYNDVEFEEAEIAAFGEVTRETYERWERFVKEGRKDGV